MGELNTICANRHNKKLCYLERGAWGWCGYSKPHVKLGYPLGACNNYMPITIPDEVPTNWAYTIRSMLEPIQYECEHKGACQYICNHKEPHNYKDSCLGKNCGWDCKIVVTPSGIEQCPKCGGMVTRIYRDKVYYGRKCQNIGKCNWKISVAEEERDELEAWLISRMQVEKLPRVVYCAGRDEDGCIDANGECRYYGIHLEEEPSDGYDCYEPLPLNKGKSDVVKETAERLGIEVVDVAMADALAELERLDKEKVTVGNFVSHFLSGNIMTPDLPDGCTVETPASIIAMRFWNEVSDLPTMHGIMLEQTWYKCTKPLERQCYINLAQRAKEKAKAKDKDVLPAKEDDIPKLPVGCTVDTDTGEIASKLFINETGHSLTRFWNLSAVSINEWFRLADKVVDKEKSEAKYYPKIEIFGTKSKRLRAKVQESRSGIPYEVTIGGIKWRNELSTTMRRKILAIADKYIGSICHNVDGAKTGEYMQEMPDVRDDRCWHYWENYGVHGDGNAAIRCKKCGAYFTFGGHEMRYFPPDYLSRDEAYVGNI